MGRTNFTQPTDEELSYIKEWNLKCKGDFALFCYKLLGIRLNEGQKRVNKIIEEDGLDAPVTLLLSSNRFGKSVYLALKHIYKAYYKEMGHNIRLSSEDWKILEYVTLNIAPSSENTKVMMEYILQICRGEFPIKQKDGSYKSNKSYLRYFVDYPGLNNYDKVPDQGPYMIRYVNRSKSRFFTLGMSHGDTIQGRAFMYASYDEFARSKAPEREIDDILPRLMQYGGSLDIITTPDEENELTTAYLSEKKDLIELGELNWRFLDGNMNENEFLPHEEMGKYLQGTSDSKRAQIMEGKISFRGATYYDISKVIKVFDDKLPYNVPPIPGHLYSCGLDTAGGGKDYWAFTIWDITRLPWTKVYTYYDKFNQPGFNLNYTKNLLDRYKEVSVDVRLVMDHSNEAGAIYFGELTDYNPIKYRFGTAKGSGKSTKAELTDNLRRAINSELIKSPTDRMLKNQLLSYKGPQDDKKQTTDAIMSNALAIFYPYKEYVYGKTEIIYSID